MDLFTKMYATDMEGKTFLHKSSGRVGKVTDIEQVWQRLPCECCSEPTGHRITIEFEEGDSDYETVQFGDSPTEFFEEIT